MIVGLARGRSLSGLIYLHRSFTAAARRQEDKFRMSVQQPAWNIPERIAPEPVLKIYNSLTRTKTEFVPKNGRHVKWYNCGPTVYDASHMGHARNYVTQDILRRIMSDYFGYDVHFVMNITDIDDKIIIRARQNHLFENFRANTKTLSSELIDETLLAWRSHVRGKVCKSLSEADRPVDGEEELAWPRLLEQIQNKEWKQECLRRDEKFEMNFSSAARTLVAIRTAQSHVANGQTGAESAHQLINDSKDILAQALDSQHSATVTDPAIPRSLAAFWEGRFFEDMARLRVRDPDTITRVTEYVPEIVAYVEKIIQNGYAYEAEGSVYFDTRTFDNADGHDYAKLEPWSKGNRDLLEDGEGALSKKSGSRSASDFALWKASKPGEPSWPSPWGAGRPGWHIECSVMASAIFGDNMDIHSGGIDLAFPHHDNEMAQSEAYHNCGSWVNYFIHTGHLHIEGLKMSKSLKNFITIDEILEKHTARQLRLAFLTQLWNAKIDFSESLMTGEVRGLEQTLNNFFTVVKALVNQARADFTKSDGYHHYEGPESELTRQFYESQSKFRAALCDSFNTPVALDVLRDLVSKTNVYINSRGKNLNVGVVENCARWIGQMLRMFGLGEGENLEIGWGQADQEGGAINREEILMPYLRQLSSFRDGVRRLAREKNDAALKDILALYGKALVKLVPPAELMKARDEKRAQAEAKLAKKAAAAEADRLKRQQKMEKGRVPPEEMFKPPNADAYGSWDDKGLPLTEKDGKELSKNQVKKVQKDWATQKKLHEEYLVWKEQNP
ncbi:hypothetical protein H0H92_012160 [Tricholoma furcatifolium]|nr:hypothetical protein H0H92_012160 [Tricholoma furcatifolium]